MTLAHGFEITHEGNITGHLRHGITVDGKRHLDFEMAPGITGDIFDAEELVSADKPVAFQGALAAVQLVSIGDIPAPVPFSLIRQLKPGDFKILTDAQEELDKMGKSEPPD